MRLYAFWPLVLITVLASGQTFRAVDEKQPDGYKTATECMDRVKEMTSAMTEHYPKELGPAKIEATCLDYNPANGPKAKPEEPKGDSI